MSTALTPPPARPFRVVEGTPVMFAGIVGVDEMWRPVTGAFASEAAAVFARLDGTLTDAGLDRRDVVAARCYLADFADFTEFNLAWRNYFGPDAPPRTTVGAVLHPPFRFEIEIVAERLERRAASENGVLP